MSDARPLPTVIGPTENALRALLGRILEPTRIGTYPAWVVLNAASRGVGPWRSDVAGALKIRTEEVDDLLASLGAAGLVSAEGALTERGRSELAAGRRAVSAATSRLVEGIGEADQAVARAVLDRIRKNAEAVLQQ